MDVVLNEDKHIISDVENGDSRVRSESDGTNETGMSLEMGIAGVSSNKDKDERPSYTVL